MRLAIVTRILRAAVSTTKGHQSCCCIEILAGLAHGMRLHISPRPLPPILLWVRSGRIRWLATVCAVCMCIRVSVSIPRLCCAARRRRQCGHMCCSHSLIVIAIRLLVVECIVRLLRHWNGVPNAIGVCWTYGHGSVGGRRRCKSRISMCGCRVSLSVDTSVV